MANRLDQKIDRIVAENGDSLHDALRALMRVNECLEAELERLRAASVGDRPTAESGSLH